MERSLTNDSTEQIGPILPKRQETDNEWRGKQVSGE